MLNPRSLTENRGWRANNIAPIHNTIAARGYISLGQGINYKSPIRRKIGVESEWGIAEQLDRVDAIHNIPYLHRLSVWSGI